MVNFQKHSTPQIIKRRLTSEIIIQGYPQQIVTLQTNIQSPTPTGSSLCLTVKIIVPCGFLWKSVGKRNDDSTCNQHQQRIYIYIHIYIYTSILVDYSLCKQSTVVHTLDKSGDTFHPPHGADRVPVCNHAQGERQRSVQIWSLNTVF